MMFSRTRKACAQRARVEFYSSLWPKNQQLRVMAGACPVGDENKQRERAGGCPVQHGQREEERAENVNPYNLVGN